MRRSPTFALALFVAVGFCASLASAAPAVAGFGFLPGGEGFRLTALEGGAPATLSGSHPYELRAHLAFATTAEAGQPGSVPDGDLRDLRLQLPAGLLANPQALPRCGASDFGLPRASEFEASKSGESCPADTQVGTVDVRTGSGAVRRFGVFNLDPAPGASAELGFAPFGAAAVFVARLRPGARGDYALSLELTGFSQAVAVTGLDLTLWGTPWSASHDGERGNCLNEAEPGFPWAKCSVGPPAQRAPLAFLTLPTDCGAPLTASASARAWQQPTPVSTTYTPEAAGGAPLTPEGCQQLRFEPSAFGQLSDQKASSASGFRFTLFDKAETLIEPAARLHSQVKQAFVTLPDGVTINPSLGAGLGVCTPAQLAAENPTAPPGSGCPNAAKIGDFRVDTPLFEKEIEGGIYLAQPDDRATSSPGAENPFDSLLAVYLVARSAQRGVLIKVAGKLIPDPASGSLSASFDNLPQLPYTTLEVSFKTGQRAPLVTPASCGVAATRIELVPWAGALQTVHSTTSSAIDAGIGGGPCPSGTPAFAPQVLAGSVNSNVGSYTPFFLRLSRGDAEQEITSYSAVLPRGITGRLAGIPFCPEASIAAARTRSGFAETADPSCPVASEIGRTLVGYGIGAALTYAPGKMYLAGPYHGFPLSIVAVDAATVGPFDLGTVVIRSAFSVDPRTAQLAIDSTGSDPIPHIIDGIPLHLREIRVLMDREAFTRNPSSCEPSAVVSTLTGSGARFGDPGDDSTASASNHFQLLNCRTLGFQPKLGIRLRGPSRRGAYPSLRATFASRGPRDSNLKSIGVTMPHSLFLAQNHIAGICTRPQFAAESCPANSVYGKAVAYTPLFDEPLRGDVYLRSSSHRLPDLVALLRSGAVRIALEGKIGPAKHGIRAQFEDLPDAPIERFTMTLAGGRHGLLTNSANICAAPPLASVKALGQNNLGRIFTSRLRGQCSKPDKQRGSR
ncbi:MAG TPA: hypothetical protein VEP91_00255 [Solirubrobacterales bacterium]|nr:hypothetical protein [Solirubrobacterales bacterium]